MPRSSPRGFSDEELDYYSRQIVLKEFGLEGQTRLKESSVCVVGAGGLGSPILTQLASMGVGRIRVVDRDVVETSNLQRQHLYGVHQVGLPKVEAAADRLRQVNPFIKVEPVPLSVSSGNADRIIEGMDVIVDALDSMATRYAVNRACVAQRTPFIHGAVIMQVGKASTIIPGETACLECFQGGIDDADLPSCSVLGVHPSIIGLIASVQVSEAVRLILGEKPVLADKLLFADLKELSVEMIQLARADTCPVCGVNPRSEPAEIHESVVEELCGRDGRRVWVFTSGVDEGVELGRLNRRLRELGYRLDVEGRLGTTFSRGKIRGSLLVSGVTIIEGVSDREAAEYLHSELLQ